MIVALRETTAENANQNWLDSNLARIGGLLQGQRDLTAVCQMIMNEVVPLVNGQAGAFYLGADGGVPQWRLAASYGLGTDDVQVSFGHGEGLVGQAAVTKQPIVVRDSRAGFTPIRSGVGTFTPSAVTEVPVLVEGEPVGVLEIASVGDYSELHLSFLERLVLTVGVAINTIRANLRTEELLGQSQRLAAELQNQSAELQRTNAELQDKAALLSEQNRNIEIKNLEIEAARRRVEENAQQLALASQYKSEFFANMSHELRTPLNSLLLLARLLADNPDKNLSAKQIEFATTIHNAGTDLLALIDDILDLSKIEAGRVTIEPGTVDLAEVVADARRAFAAQADEKGLTLEVRIAEGTAASVVTDAQRLGQILRNLLSNAVKFTERGTVTLTVLPKGSDAVAFSVRDTGIGISDEKFEMIFEAFQQADGTTSRRYGGTGLGLSISKELARLLGGSISVESTLGAGSTFTLFVPVVLPGAAPKRFTPLATTEDGLPSIGTPILRPAVGVPAVARELTGVTVLLVDDDVRNAFALTSALELHGMTVLYADNGTDGVRMLSEHPEVDIVLMDAMMPNMDGNETTRRIRQLPAGAQTPVVFLTAKAMPEDREASLAAGADDYVTWTSCSTSCRRGRWRGDRFGEGAAGRRPAGEPRCPGSDPAGARGGDGRGHQRRGGAETPAHRRLRGDPAGRVDARHGRLRDRDAHQAAGTHPAHPDHLPDRAQLRRAARVPRLPDRRGRLHHQAVRPVGAAVQGGRVHRAVAQERGTDHAGGGADGAARGAVEGVVPDGRRRHRRSHRSAAGGAGAVRPGSHITPSRRSPDHYDFAHECGGHTGRRR
jgi:signal transduction histidine kinase/CheY-like chemotaxis protein